jgi:hypothetical protein
MAKTKTERALIAAWDWVGSYEGNDQGEHDGPYYDMILLSSAWEKYGTVAKVLKACPDFPEDIVLAYEYLNKRLDARNL